MSISDGDVGVVTASGTPAPVESAAGPTGPVPAHRSEFVYFAFRNWKFVFGLAVVSGVLGLAIIGPLLTDGHPLAFNGPTDQPPSSDYWFGTTSYGQDVFAQFVYGLRAAFLVGAVGGGIAWLIGATVGFTAGYR